MSVTSLRNHSPPNNMARHKTLRRAMASTSAKMPRAIPPTGGKSLNTCDFDKTPLPPLLIPRVVARRLHSCKRAACSSSRLRDAVRFPTTPECRLVDFSRDTPQRTNAANRAQCNEIHEILAGPSLFLPPRKVLLYGGQGLCFSRDVADTRLTRSRADPATFPQRTLNGSKLDMFGLYRQVCRPPPMAQYLLPQTKKHVVKSVCPLLWTLPPARTTCPPLSATPMRPPNIYTHRATARNTKPLMLGMTVPAGEPPSAQMAQYLLQKPVVCSPPPDLCTGRCPLMCLHPPPPLAFEPPLRVPPAPLLAMIKPLNGATKSEPADCLPTLRPMAQYLLPEPENKVVSVYTPLQSAVDAAHLCPPPRRFHASP